jgi:hypothetical protein
VAFWVVFLGGFEILRDFSLDLGGFVYWLNVVVGPWRQGRQAECTPSGKLRPTFLGFFFLVKVAIGHGFPFALDAGNRELFERTCRHCLLRGAD